MFDKREIKKNKVDYQINNAYTITQWNKQTSLFLFKIKHKNEKKREKIYKLNEKIQRHAGNIYS